MKLGGKIALYPGDHVVRWIQPEFRRHFQPTQHHGILLDMEFDFGIDDWILTVADFSRYPRKSHLSSDHYHWFKGRHIASWQTPASEWFRVEYGSQNYEKIFAWAGTSTTVKSDCIEIVLKRAMFLLSSYSKTKRLNLTVDDSCECITMWCKTGKWNTLQGASWAQIMQNKVIHTGTAQAGAAFFSVISRHAFLHCLGPQTEASLGCSFPDLVSISAVGNAAMNAVILRWLGEPSEDTCNEDERLHRATRLFQPSDEAQDIRRLV